MSTNRAPLTTVRVTDTQGRTIHIGPHDIFRHDPTGDPIHKETAEADVCVDAVVEHGSIAVIMWHAGPSRGAVVYDRDDRVRWVA